MTLQTFVSRVTFLHFSTLSRFVITFLPRSNCLLISWLQSPSAVILEHKKRKSVTASTLALSICHAVMGLNAIIFFFFFFLIFNLTLWASLVAQMVKNLPAVWETQVQSLGQEDPLEEEMATHSSSLAWKIPWIRSLAGYSPWGHKESTRLSDLTN